jgi:hypothetical protein
MKAAKPLCSRLHEGSKASVFKTSEFLATERRCIVIPMRYELNLCYEEESRLPPWSGGQSSCLQNVDVLCFLLGTNLIYMLCREK